MRRRASVAAWSRRASTRILVVLACMIFIVVYWAEKGGIWSTQQAFGDPAAAVALAAGGAAQPLGLTEFVQSAGVPRGATLYLTLADDNYWVELGEAAAALSQRQYPLVGPWVGAVGFPGGGARLETRCCVPSPWLLSSRPRPCPCPCPGPASCRLSCAWTTPSWARCAHTPGLLCFTGSVGTRGAAITLRCWPARNPGQECCLLGATWVAGRCILPGRALATPTAHACPPHHTTCAHERGPPCCALRVSRRACRGVGQAAGRG